MLFQGIHHNRVLALWAFSAGIFCIQLDAFALSLALPQIGRDLSASEGWLKWVTSGYLLSVGMFMLGSGRLSDRYGYYRILILGEFLFGVASLLCAIAPSMPWLVFFRIIQGVAGALIMPAGLALLTNIYPKNQGSRAIGLAIGIGGAATACGPFLGGLLTEWYSWRLIFWINVPIALFGAYAAWLCRNPESEQLGGARLDIPGLVIITVAIGLFSFVLNNLVTGAMTVRANIIFTSISIVLAGCFVMRERKSEAPLIDVMLFRNGSYVVLSIAGAMANAATVIFLFVVPLSLQSVWELSPNSAGIAFLLPAILMSFGGPLAGRVKASNAVLVMGVCLCVAAIAFIMTPRLQALDTYLAMITLCGAFLGIANALTLVATQAVVRPEIAGVASGLTKTVITLAAGFGVVLSGQSADQALGLLTGHVIQSTMVNTGICCLGAFGILTLWWMARRRTA